MISSFSDSPVCRKSHAWKSTLQRIFVDAGINYGVTWQEWKKQRSIVCVIGCA